MSEQEREDWEAGTGRLADDRWIPACGGTERPFVTRTRRRLLYVWNPASGKHAYIDLDTDIILTNEEAQQAIALW